MKDIVDAIVRMKDFIIKSGLEVWLLYFAPLSDQCTNMLLMDDAFMMAMLIIRYHMPSTI